jgi:hypothetical protein
MVDLRLSADKDADSTRFLTALSLLKGGATESGIVMLNSYWTPSIVPAGDQDTCLVIDDLGKLGLIYCESDVATANVDHVIEHLLDGQYSNPIRVISFNVANGWSRDISAQVAAELRRLCDLQLRDVPSSIQGFMERHEGRSRQLSLRLL